MDPAETKPLILIAEDDPALLEMYGRKLELSGFKVIKAHNGAEAVEFARAQKPVLILMDFKMPVMDGVEAVMQLKASPETASIKVVFLTAYGDSNVPDIDPRYAQELGATAFFQKGIELDKLIDKIHEFIK